MKSLDAAHSRVVVLLAMIVGVRGEAYAAEETTVTVAQRTLMPSLRFRTLSVEQGLPNVTISGIRQDRDGYMWIGTYDGLARYDGYAFTVVRDKLPDLTVTAVELDPTTGDLWVGTTKGVARVNPSTREVTNFSLAPKGAPAPAPGESAVLAIAVASDGSVWVGTNGFGLVRIDPKSGASEVFRHENGGAKPISFDTVTTLLAEKDKLWIGTGGAGVDVLSISQRSVTAHFDLSHADRKDAADVNLIQAIHRDASGALWLGTAGGLARLDEKTGKAQIFTLINEVASPSNDITDLLDGDDGKLWVATHHNLFSFDPKQGTTSASYSPDRGDPGSLPGDALTILFRDRENVMWVGTRDRGMGLVHSLSQYFTFYNFDVRSYLEDSKGHMWLGTPSELCRVDQPHTLTGTLSCFQIGGVVRFIHEDDEGIIWGGTITSGMLRLDPKTATVRFYEPSAAGAPNSGPNASMIMIIRGTRDGLWLATFGGGLNYFDKSTGTFRVYAHDPGDKTSLSSDSIYQLTPAKRGGGYLVGTASGLDRFDPNTGRATSLTRDSAHPDRVDVVLSVYEQDDGTVWIGTYGGGLKRIDPARNQTQSFVDPDERGRNTVFGVIPDDRGSLWLSTDAGVSRFDIKTATFERYYPSDGLQGLAYTQPSTYKDSKGLIYFGGVNGMNVFRPSQIRRTEHRAPLVLRRMEIDGKDTPNVDSITKAGLSLPYKHKVINLDFSVLSYINPEASHYQYRIEGLHDWVDLGTHNFLTLNTLPTGNYTLHVKGKSRTGTWNEGIQFSINVSPPPWRTWWAYLTYGLLVALVIGVIVRRQRAQLAALRDTHRLVELEREIALTSAISEGCLPAEQSVRDRQFSLEGFFRPAAECGGDWWSYEARGDRYLVVVADATGHGAGSAMLTAATVACFRSLQSIVDDDARMQAMNEEVLRMSRGQYHMTLTAVELDINTGEYTVVSAGGVPVFTLPLNGRPKVLMCPGTPLGTQNLELGQLTGKLMPGERLLLLTDGLPEVEVANAHLLGPRGIANILMQTRNLGLAEALNQLIGMVEAVQVGRQDDDWTAVMLQWSSPHGAQPVRRSMAVAD